MPFPKRAAIGLSVLAISSIAYFVGKNPQLLQQREAGISDHPQDLAPDRSVSQQRGFRTRDSRPVGTTKFRPLDIPPDAGPLARSFNQLASLAYAGEPEAACTLAVELNNCRNREKSLAAAGRISNAMAAGQASKDAQAVDTVAMILNSAGALDKSCAGVSSEMIDSAYDMQRVAANASSDQARWLATNPLLDKGNIVQDLKRWTDYQQFAERYFANSAIRRDYKDLIGLLLVHYPGETSLPRPPYKKPDPERFLALLEVARSAGINLPHDIIATGEQLAAGNVAPAPSLSKGWTGQPPKSLDAAIRDSMFPIQPEQFCSGK